MNALPEFTAASQAEQPTFRRHGPPIRLMISLGALLLALFLSTALFAQEEGYIYTVQPGDNWVVVAKRVGLTVEELKAANPQAIRPSGWLIINEKLTIPAPKVEERYYEVQRGEGWTVIAEKLGVNLRLLQAVNPRAMRASEVLYTGERLLIPVQAVAPSVTATANSASQTATTTGTATSAPKASPSPTETVIQTATETASPEPSATQTPTPAPTDTPEPTETVTPEPTATPEPTETATPEPTATPLPTDTPAPTDIPTETATPDPLAVLPACPESFNAYADALTEVLNTERSLLDSFAEGCGFAENFETVQTDLTGDGVEDLVLTYRNRDTTSQRAVTRRSELIIVDGSSDAESPFTLGHVAYAAGEVRLLATEDVNNDGKADVVWIDTTCGASTCFDTVYIRTWDGSTWRDWTEGTITMAGAEVTLVDAEPEINGQELQLIGGIYGSVGAGPQRERTEIWTSADGTPYALYRETFGESDCLYHTILDANNTLASGDQAGAKLLYEESIANGDLVACWSRPNEVDELRSFALFRLALLSGYEGDSDGAQAVVDQINDSYPAQPYTNVANRWLDAYRTGGDVAAACSEVNAFAEVDGAAVAVLADYGYANPTFTAAEICPILDESGSGAASAPLGDSALVLTAGLPSCPETLVDYGKILPEVLTIADDILVMETWLRLCDALTDDRGDLVVEDLNGNGEDDLLIFPTIISDVGHGPGGAEGILLLFHPTGDGGYEAVYSQETYGQPTLLRVGDLNLDGENEIIWQLESCSTSCITGVQSLAWDGESATYVPGLLPGAATANGQVIIEPVPDGDPGTGQQIRLVGGISGTPGGGLAVAHTEIWQSIDGGSLRRISWTYDRAAEDSDCLGLRLVEADIAMQVADVLGYDAAIELYSAALADDSLRACSLFGMDEEEELALLRGLGNFRLIQAQALGGDGEAAMATLEALSAAQPDADYTTIATQWLESFSADGDVAVACEGVVDIFEVSSELWQVTDNYGYDHPALAAEQICFVPLGE